MPVIPDFRFRRLRANPIIRDLVRETTVSMDDFIYPIFVQEGITDAVLI